jgi:hypothetical protein
MTYHYTHYSDTNQWNLINLTISLKRNIIVGFATLILFHHNHRWLNLQSLVSPFVT